MIFNVGIPAKTRILGIVPPTVTVGTYTYNGSAQGPSVSAYDTNLISVIGATGVDAGNYVLTLSLKNKVSYRWSDGTNSDKEYPYSINKTSTSITLSANSATVVSGDPVTAPITVSTNSDATLTVSSSNNNVVTAVVSGGKIHINPSISISGQATLTVTAPETTNCSSATATVTVTVTLSTVTWASGTTQQIAAMLRAHYAGVINIHNYWSVGDKRTISLNAISAYDTVPAMPAQNLVFVLVHSGGKICYDLWKEDHSGKKECAFVVGAESCLNTKCQLDTVDTWQYGYGHKDIWYWLADGYAGGHYSNHFWAMFPDGYFNGDIFKRTYWYAEDVANKNAPTVGTYRSSNIGTFGLPSEVEVFGTHTYSSPDDTDDDYASVFSYYSASNRAKKLGISGSAVRWWLRSIDYDASDNIGRFVNVYTNGGNGGIALPSTSYGICPHGVI